MASDVWRAYCIAIELENIGVANFSYLLVASCEPLLFSSQPMTQSASEQLLEWYVTLACILSVGALNRPSFSLSPLIANNLLHLLTQYCVEPHRYPGYASYRQASEGYCLPRPVSFSTPAQLP